MWSSVYPGTPNSQHLVPGTPNSHLGSVTPNSHLGSVTPTSHLGSVTPTSHHAPPCTTPQTHHTLTNVITNNNAYFSQVREAPFYFENIFFFQINNFFNCLFSLYFYYTCQFHQLLWHFDSDFRDRIIKKKIKIYGMKKMEMHNTDI